MSASDASPDAHAQAIATRLLARDPFSQWLKLELGEARAGYCRLYLRVRPDMLNGFGTLHSGVAFAAADTAFAMELGCDGVLMNTAVAGAQDPLRMAKAMRLAVQAGREAYLAGRIPRKRFASASSPLEGVFF